MQLRTIIVDDEPLAHEVIKEHAKDVPFISIVGQCYSGTEALSFVNANPVDLIFLDIQMPKLNGLDFLKILKKSPLVIITSAYQEYALESFELDVCDYLLKPFRFERFLKATNKALEQFQLKNQATAIQPLNNDSTSVEVQQLFIKTDKRFVQVNLKDIYYLESFGNYVKVWIENDFLLTARTLTSFTEQLPSDDFVRIHKSFIINKQFIAYLEGNTVILKNKKQLQIGKSHKQSVMQLMRNDD